MKILSLLFTFVALSLFGACPFCNPVILEKETIYKGKDVVVLYCLTPATDGHILIVPRRHILRFEELNSSELLETHEIISKMAKMFKDIYSASDYMIVQKNGMFAGQTQPHVHFHAIPCSESIEKLKINLAFYRAHITHEEMKEQCEKLRSYWECIYTR